MILIFQKRIKVKKSVKGSVRRKISALENINNFFAQDLYIEEGFRKNKVSCVIATSDNKITIGFSDGMYSRPKTLLKGNMLNMSTNQIDLILSKKKMDKTFNKIEYGNEEILSYYHKDIYHLISKKLNLNEIHYFMQRKKFSAFFSCNNGKEKEYEKHIEER